MCTTCGCGAGQTLIGGHALKLRKQARGQVQYRTPDHSAHEHSHDHAPVHSHDSIDFGTGPGGAHAPGMTQARMVKIERDILSKNDSYASKNRGHLAAHGIFALNLVSSPGSGKTTLRVKSITALSGSVPLAVTEGEDKPLKYPDMLRASDLMLLNKCDLLPYLTFDANLAIENARRVNPNLK
jgi:hydrogenase nickel incorporation protein HypB